MLGFVTPPDVRRSFKLTPEFVEVGENVLAAYRSYVEAARRATLIGSGQIQRTK
jgi:hypothetical protein